jgi:hypothetical protein
MQRISHPSKAKPGRAAQRAPVFISEKTEKVVAQRTQIPPSKE